METVSKKRGRPAAFDPGAVAAVRGLFPSVRSARGMQNKMYELEAVKRLRAGSCELIDGVENIMTTGHVYLATILEHLGRLKVGTEISDDDIRAVARWLSSRFEVDPTFTVRRAVALVRELRDEIGARLYAGWYHGEPGKLLELLATDEGDA